VKITRGYILEEVRDALKFWLDYSQDVMIKNMEFLLRNYRDVADSCNELINDLIDIWFWVIPSKGMDEGERKKMLERFLMYPMLLHVAFPNSYLLCPAILLGAISQAFYTLRTILEGIAIALYADSKDELKDLPWYKKVEHKSVRNATVHCVKDHLLKVLERAFSIKEGEELLNHILDLYQAISAWVHPVAKIRFDKGKEIAAGILKAVMITMAQHGAPPAYGVLVPMEYGSEDLDDLKCLNEAIEHTRLAVTVMVYAWSLDKELANREALKKYLDELSKPIRGQVIPPND